MIEPASKKQYRKRCDEVLLSRGHENAQKHYTYELVTDLSTNELAKAMIDGEVFYSHNGKNKYLWDNGMFVDANGESISTMRKLYRRKEIETITRTITYPKPASEPLNAGDSYWFIGLNALLESRWRNNVVDNARLKQNRIHITKENAQAHLDALFGDN